MKNEIVRKTLAAELDQLSMTKAEICKEIGVTPKTLDGCLAGRSIPSKTLVALRDLTGKTVHYLLDLPTYD